MRGEITSLDGPGILVTCTHRRPSRAAIPEGVDITWRESLAGHRGCDTGSAARCEVGGEVMVFLPGFWLL